MDSRTERRTDGRTDDLLWHNRAVRLCAASRGYGGLGKLPPICSLPLPQKIQQTPFFNSYHFTICPQICSLPQNSLAPEKMFYSGSFGGRPQKLRKFPQEFLARSVVASVGPNPVVAETCALQSQPPSLHHNLPNCLLFPQT